MKARTLFAATIAFATGSTALVATPAPCVAQNAPPAVTATTPRAGTRPVADTLARIGQAAGVTVVTDSFPAERLPLPTEPVTPENVERHLDQAVKSLPAGAVWVKLYLPPSPTGRPWRGEDAGAYAALRARLFQVKDTPPAGMVEVLGQRLPVAEAGEVITRLKLKPVYLVTDAKSKATPSWAAGGNMNEWMRMTPEQRWNTAQQQATDIMAADPAVVEQVFTQQAMVFGAMVQRMSPEQRQQLFAGMQQFFQQLNASGLGPGDSGGGTPQP